MQKAYNRFWDWLFHPSVRWNHYPKGKAAWFRYPSPASQPQTRNHPNEDYRTPYEYSQYNIRYHKPVQSLVNVEMKFAAIDGAQVTQIDKLKRAGVLKEANPSQQAIKQAKKKYFQKLGVPVEQRAFGFQGFIPPVGPDRQAIRSVVQQRFKASRQQRKILNDSVYDRKHIDHPNSVFLQSLDLYVQPHFQQTRAQVDYRLQELSGKNADRGYIQIQKGEKSFWKALDNSNDPKDVQKVQKALGDDAPLVQQRRSVKILLEKDQKGNVIDVKPNTRSV